ncbi:MAG TPA: hypothetical protein VNE62_06350 [Actinomycetota bacterium]|nr:hypothetical protein [Actinomycetota bacterium]
METEVACTGVPHRIAIDPDGVTHQHAEQDDVLTAFGAPVPRCVGVAGLWRQQWLFEHLPVVARPATRPRAEWINEIRRRRMRCQAEVDGRKVDCTEHGIAMSFADPPAHIRSLLGVQVAMQRPTDDLTQAAAAAEAMRATCPATDLAVVSCHRRLLAQHVYGWSDGTRGAMFVSFSPRWESEVLDPGLQVVDGHLIIERKFREVLAVRWTRVAGGLYPRLARAALDRSSTRLYWH